MGGYIRILRADPLCGIAEIKNIVNKLYFNKK